MTTVSELIAYEQDTLNPQSPVVRQLLDYKAAAKNGQMDWLRTYQDGVVDLTMTALRLAMFWTQIQNDEQVPFSYGTGTFTAENIQGALFQYEIDVPLAFIKFALRSQVKAGLIEYVDGKYRATRPTEK